MRFCNSSSNFSNSSLSLISCLLRSAARSLMLSSSVLSWSSSRSLVCELKTLTRYQLLQLLSLSFVLFVQIFQQLLIFLFLFLDLPCTFFELAANLSRTKFCLTPFSFWLVQAFPLQTSYIPSLQFEVRPWLLMQLCVALQILTTDASSRGLRSGRLTGEFNSVPSATTSFFHCVDQLLVDLFVVDFSNLPSVHHVLCVSTRWILSQ